MVVSCLIFSVIEHGCLLRCSILDHNNPRYIYQIYTKKKLIITRLGFVTILFQRFRFDFTLFLSRKKHEIKYKPLIYGCT
jgi:hypothetical protein